MIERFVQGAKTMLEGPERQRALDRKMAEASCDQLEQHVATLEQLVHHFADGLEVAEALPRPFEDNETGDYTEARAHLERLAAARGQIMEHFHKQLKMDDGGDYESVTRDLLKQLIDERKPLETNHFFARDRSDLSTAGLEAALNLAKYTEAERRVIDVMFAHAQQVHSAIGRSLESYRKDPNPGARLVEQMYGFTPRGAVYVVEQPFSIALSFMDPTDYLHARHYTLFENSAITDDDRRSMALTDSSAGFHRKQRVGRDEFSVICIRASSDPEQLYDSAVTFVHESIHVGSAISDYALAVADQARLDPLLNRLVKYAELKASYTTGNVAHRLLLKVIAGKRRMPPTFTPAFESKVSSVYERYQQIEKDVRNPALDAEQRRAAYRALIPKLIDIIYQTTRTEILAYGFTGELDLAVAPSGSNDSGVLERKGSSYDLLKDSSHQRAVHIASLCHSGLKLGSPTIRELETVLDDEIAGAFAEERERYFEVVRRAAETFKSLEANGKLDSAVHKLAMLDVRDWPNALQYL